MKWPWKRSKDPGGGAQARLEAQENLEQAVARWPEVTRVSRSLRDLRETNHFGETIEAIFQGRSR